MFSHLNVHSVYSKMKGTATPLELVQRARSARMTHMALTEINGLWGFINFVRAARENDILPIAGCNLLNDHDDVILLAESQKGYENMCFIISAQHDSPSGRISEWAKPYTKDIFFISPKESSLQTLVNIVPSSHLFVELRPGMQESTAHKLTHKFRLETVVTGDVYFLHSSHVKNHKVLCAIEKNTTLSQLKEGDFKSAAHYFRTEKELVALFPNSLAAINNSQYLAERCKTDWNYINTIFPEMSLKKNHRANMKLKQLVKHGAKKRYPKLSDKITKRISHELSIISQKGFAPYFLIVADIVNQTKACIGRGSGAASIISYCLKITQVDPIKYNLQFERFIHPERVDMPDIDVDFPWDERDDILDYVFRKYGLQRTAMVSSQVFMQPRSAIREVGKVYGLSSEEIHTINKRIGYGHSRTELAKWVINDKRFQNAVLNETLMEVITQSEKILGAFRVSSVHPGGMVIVPDKIRKYVPVLMATKGVQIVEWDKDQVEDAGLVKIDLLGNRSLAVVRDTLKQIDAKDNPYINYHAIQPVGDAQTERVMKAGLTMGVFYIESPATRLLLKKAGNVDFEHVVIYSSIIRPAANRFINMLIERIHGKPWKLLHPDLTCLEESYGIMVYEEQVSAVAHDIAGFSYAEADYLRKVISNSGLIRLLPIWRKKFLSQAQKNGYEPRLANELWTMMQSFSGYSFCKPHSASYAMLSFTCAYLKAHFTAEFLAAVVSNQGGYYSPFAYLSEARRWGICILPPDINKSGRTYLGKGSAIRMGFMAIRELQNKAIDQILLSRKAGSFASLEDVFLRLDIDFSDAMALTKAQCFKEIAPELSYRQITFAVAYFYQHPDNKFLTHGSAALPNAKLSHGEKRQLEMTSFGFSISEHPLERYFLLFNDAIKKARDIHLYTGKAIYLAGVYITRKITSTKKDEPMEFVTFEDETDIYECVMFPKVFEKYSDLLIWETLFIIKGTVECAFGVYTINIEKLFSLQKIAEKKNSQIRKDKTDVRA